MTTLKRMLAALRLFNEMIDTSPSLMGTEIGEEIIAVCQQIVEKSDNRAYLLFKTELAPVLANIIKRVSNANHTNHLAN